MDLHQLEYAARMFFSFCEQHPDLCPHDWQWSWCRNDSKTAKTSGYRCSLCGSEKAIRLERQENESDYDWERRH